MATRFYLPSTGIPTPAGVPFSDRWENTAQAVRRPTGTTKGTSAFAESTCIDDGPVNTWDSLIGQFVSDPLAAQTISGTVKGIIRARESATAANSRAQMVVRVVSGDGLTTRGILLDQNDGTTVVNEFVATTTPTSARNAKFPLAWAAPGATLTDVQVQDGDRLVIEVGGRGVNGTTTAYTLGLRFGENSATDLAENETGTTEGAPWVEFSQDIEFQTATGDNRTATSAAAAPFPSSGSSGTSAAPTTTRFYFPSTGTPDVLPDPSATWDDSSNMLRAPAVTARVGSPFVEITDQEGSSAADWDLLLGQFVSAPLVAQTLGGFVKGMFRGRQNSNTANARSQLVVRVVSSDGLTVRGTLVPENTSTANINEWVNAAAGNNRGYRFPVGWTAPGAATSTVQAQAGDRLVFEVGARMANTSTTSTLGAGIRFGDDLASDLDETEDGTVDGNPWVEFVPQILFQVSDNRTASSSARVPSPVAASTGTRALPASTADSASSVPPPASAASATRAIPARTADSASYTPLPATAASATVANARTADSAAAAPLPSATSDGTAQGPAPGGESYSAAVLADAPRLYWRMGITDPEVHLEPDASGNNFGGDAHFAKRGRTGPITSEGAANLAFGFDRDGQTEAVQSNGLSNSGRATPDALGISNHDCTVEAWVRPTGSHNYYGVWEIGDKNGGDYLSLHSANNQNTLYLHTWTSTDYASGIPVTWNAWNHVVVTYTASDQTIRCYVDGATTPAYTRTYAWNPTGDQTTFLVGQINGSTWLGEIDEVAVYDGVLSTARIAAHFAAATSGGQPAAPGTSSATVPFPSCAASAASAAPGGGAELDYPAAVLADGPRLYWRFLESTGGISDSSGNGRTGGATGLTEADRSATGPLLDQGAGIATKAYAFDGSNKAVTASGTTAATLNIDGGAKPWTIECWTRATGTGITYVGAWEVGTRSGGAYAALCHTDSETGYSVNTYGPNATFTGLAHGVWQLVHVTYDPAAANKLKAYVNGDPVLDSATTIALGTGIPFLVGGLDGRFWVGDVAEVAVYDKVLSTARMAAHLDASGHGVPPAPGRTASGDAVAPAPSSAASGTHAAPAATATSASTIPAAASAASGTRDVPERTGQSDAAVPSPASAASGNRAPPEVSGTSDTALPPVASSAGASRTIPERTGASAAALPPPASAATGTRAIPERTAASASGLPAAASAATGSRTIPERTGASGSETPFPASAATADRTPPGFAAESASAVPPPSSTSAGERAVPARTATSASAIPPPAAAADGSRAIPVRTAASASVLPAAASASAGAGTRPESAGTSASAVPTPASAASGTRAIPERTAAAASTVPSPTAAATAQRGVPERTAASASAAPAPSASAAATAARPVFQGTSAAVPPMPSAQAAGTVPLALHPGTSASTAALPASASSGASLAPQPTRFYLPRSGTPALLPAWEAVWNDTAGAVRAPAPTAPTGTAFGEAARAETSTSNGWDVGLGQFVSAPLRPQTITGTCKGIIRARESNTAANARSQMVVKVVSSDGLTVRGILVAFDGAIVNENEWVASGTASGWRNAKFPLARAWGGGGTTAPAVTQVTTQLGDHIVIEVGGRAVNTVSTSYTLALRLGDAAASDLAENETGTTELNPWVELSHTVLFVEPVTVVSAAVLPSPTSGSAALNVAHVGASAGRVPSPVTAAGSTHRPPTAGTSSAAAPFPASAAAAEREPPRSSGTSASAVPSPAAAATAQRVPPPATGTSASAVPPPASAVSGTAAAPTRTATSAVSVPAPSASASATALAPGFAGTSDAAVPAPRSSGTAGAQPPQFAAASAAAAPAPRASATAAALAPHFQAASGAAVPAPRASASASAQPPLFAASSAAVLPFPSSAASGARAMPGTAGTSASRIPGPSAAAQGARTIPDRLANSASAAPLPRSSSAASRLPPPLSATSAALLPATVAVALGQVDVPLFAGPSAARVPFPSAAADAQAVRPLFAGPADASAPFPSTSGDGRHVSPSAADVAGVVELAGAVTPEIDVAGTVVLEVELTGLVAFETDLTGEIMTA